METAKRITVPTFPSFLLLQVASMELQPCRKSNLISSHAHTHKYLPHTVTDEHIHITQKRNKGLYGHMHAPTQTHTQKCKTAETKAYRGKHMLTVTIDTHIQQEPIGRAQQRGLLIVCSLQHTHCSFPSIPYLIYHSYIIKFSLSLL